MNSDFEQIERYLEEDLSKEEKQTFEQRLDEDSQLREQLALHRLARQAGVLLIEDEIRERLDHIRRRGRRPVFRLGVLGIAAAMLVLAAVGTLLFAQLNYSGSALAESYRMGPLTTLQADRGASDPFELAQALVLTGQTGPETVDLLERLGPSQPNYLKAQYLLAHTYLRAEEYDKAVARFQELLPHKDEVARWAELKEIRWNTALSLLGAGREEAAREQLTEIARDSDLRQAQRAEELLQQLDSPWHRLAPF